MDTMTAENVTKPNVLILNGQNNVNRDLNCNEKLAELLSSDLNIEIDIELVKNFRKRLKLGREIDRHARNCSKTKRKAIKKTNFRGILFKQEQAKCCCRAIMKKVKRNVLVHISRRTSLVEKASCTCPAGKSGYCNHVMALLHELAEYSLNSLEKVPPEKACTSQLCKWDLPGGKETVKEPTMRTAIISQTSKKGIQPTIYEARANFNIDENKVSIIEMNNKLLSIDKSISF